MSALTERIAAEHEPQLIEGSWSDYYDCTCGAWSSLDSHDESTGSLAAHVAEVTEVAVRESIAAQLDATDEVEWALAGQHAGAMAATIARNKESK